MYIQLDMAKKHLNIEDDFIEDDEYILNLIEVAEAAVRVHINESFNDIAAKNGGCLPSPILQAALLMVGSLYQNREIVGSKVYALPYNYQYLIDLYKNYNN
jgi:uncharacterized phage protein (predicted DNA packaging)